MKLFKTLVLALLAANALMLSFCTQGIANLVTAYRGGQKSDWFLPSKGELTAMLKAAEIIGDFSIGSYWGSSLSHAYGIWHYTFFGGAQYASDETSASLVRPIRASG